MVRVIAPHTAGMGRNAGKLDIKAEVIASARTFETTATRKTGLDGNAVARLEVSDLGASPDDLAGGFVAETVLGLNFQASNSACMPEVNVGARKQWWSGSDVGNELRVVEASLPADSVASYMHDALVRFWVQLRGRAHKDLMMLISEESRIRLRRLEFGHLKNG